MNAMGTAIETSKIDHPPGALKPQVLFTIEQFPPPEAHDRIDFIYYAGPGVTPTVAELLGYDLTDGNADVQIRPYPSDRRALVAEFALAPEPGTATILLAGVDWTAARLKRLV